MQHRMLFAEFSDFGEDEALEDRRQICRFARKALGHRVAFIEAICHQNRRFRAGHAIVTGINPIVKKADTALPGQGALIARDAVADLNAADGGFVVATRRLVLPDVEVEKVTLKPAAFHAVFRRLGNANFTQHRGNSFSHSILQAWRESRPAHPRAACALPAHWSARSSIAAPPA